ncbi:1403_t:CDS:2 [Ambispora leptoticha]|uniref:1403_t:CDS:1 n=1 Tax=Ambispora leptoticha TaxID=144679 RepID=A0A9N8W5J4_9GLOM|nr:1403_t:CDS:2 [Ambispora leptoticha]
MSKKGDRLFVENGLASSYARNKMAGIATKFLVGGMLLSGVCNTILNKLQDMQCVNNCDNPDPKKREYFEQPVWQTLNMFIGETMCFVLVNYVPIESEGEEESSSRIKIDEEVSGTTEELTGWKVLLFWLPTMADILGTTLMNVGLIYTSASVYQMLRGAVVIFTAAFSIIFLKRTLYAFHWASIFLVVLGVTIVGLSSVLFPPRKPSDSNLTTITKTEGISDAAAALIGVFFVIIAQIFTASQFVIEEKIMHKYRVEPLRAVGLEGIFGLITVSVGMIILHFIYGVTHPDGYFNISNGFHQIFDNAGIWQTGVAICFSIAFFNFFGLSVTRTLSATARSTIDTTRNLFIWIVALFLGWETFSWLQLIGFAILVWGTFLFNGVVRPPSFLEPPAPAPGRRRPSSENAPLLTEPEHI